MGDEMSISINVYGGFVRILRGYGNLPDGVLKKFFGFFQNVTQKCAIIPTVKRGIRVCSRLVCWRVTSRG